VLHRGADRRETGDVSRNPVKIAITPMIWQNIALNMPFRRHRPATSNNVACGGGYVCSLHEYYQRGDGSVFYSGAFAWDDLTAAPTLLSYPDPRMHQPIAQSPFWGPYDNTQGWLSTWLGSMEAMNREGDIIFRSTQATTLTIDPDGEPQFTGIASYHVMKSGSAYTELPAAVSWWVSSFTDAEPYIYVGTDGTLGRIYDSAIQEDKALAQGMSGGFINTPTDLEKMQIVDGGLLLEKQIPEISGTSGTQGGGIQTSEEPEWIKVPLPFDYLVVQNAGWSNVSAVGINNHGLIIGTASYQLTGTDGQPVGQPEEHGVILLPVEILVKSTGTAFDKGTNKLRIATLESAFGGSGYTLGSNAFENDKDSFKIRMINPAKKGSGKMKVKLSSTNEDSNYNGTSREIELIETPADSGTFISHPQILVSNAADADHSFTFAGSDDTYRTHKIALSGTLVVEIDPLGGTNYQRLEAAKVPVEKTVKIKPIVLKKNGVGVMLKGEVDYDIRTIRETFAQCGIKVVASEISYVADSDAGISLEGFWRDGLRTNVSPTNITQDEANLFNYIADNNLRASDEITFIYVNCFRGHGSLEGFAYIKKFTPDKPRRINHVFMAADHQEKFVAPHELLHILLDAAHPWPNPEYSYEFNHYRMVWGANRGSTGFWDRKRITERTGGKQGKDAKASPFAKSP